MSSDNESGSKKRALYSVQPKVSIRVDGATELGVRGSQSATELMSGNSRERSQPQFLIG